MGARRINVPQSLFEPVQETKPSTLPQSPLEKFLGRHRDAETGNLIPKKRNKSRTVAASSFTKTTIETEEMIASRVWDDACPRHLVALHGIMHQKTYGVPASATGKELYIAVTMAKRMVETEFGGDIVAAVEYLRWVWTTEASSEKWRRENNRPGGSINLFFMFSGRLVTRYRVSLAREQARR